MIFMLSSASVKVWMRQSLRAARKELGRTADHLHPLPSARLDKTLKCAYFYRRRSRASRVGFAARWSNPANVLAFWCAWHECIAIGALAGRAAAT